MVPMFPAPGPDRLPAALLCDDSFAPELGRGILRLCVHASPPGEPHDGGLRRRREGVVGRTDTASSHLASLGVAVELSASCHRSVRAIALGRDSSKTDSTGGCQGWERAAYGSLVNARTPEILNAAVLNKLLDARWGRCTGPGRVVRHCRRTAICIGRLKKNNNLSVVWFNSDRSGREAAYGFHLVHALEQNRNVCLKRSLVHLSDLDLGISPVGCSWSDDVPFDDVATYVREARSRSPSSNQYARRQKEEGRRSSRHAKNAAHPQSTSQFRCIGPREPS